MWCQFGTSCSPIKLLGRTDGSTDSRMKHLGCPVSQIIYKEKLPICCAFFPTKCGRLKRFSHSIFPWFWLSPQKGSFWWQVDWEQVVRWQEQVLFKGKQLQSKWQGFPQPGNRFLVLINLCSYLVVSHVPIIAQPPHQRLSSKQIKVPAQNTNYFANHIWETGISVIF